jgi:hypothetical protein
MIVMRQIGGDAPNLPFPEGGFWDGVSLPSHGYDRFGGWKLKFSYNKGGCINVPLSHISVSHKHLLM